MIRVIRVSLTSNDPRDPRLVDLNDPRDPRLRLTQQFCGSITIRTSGLTRNSWNRPDCDDFVWHLACQQRPKG